MFEQDYIMRCIKEMIRAILKLLFNVDTEASTVELLESTEQKEVLKKILDMVDEGDVNEAENQVDDLISEGNRDNLKTVLLFYFYLNDKPDEFLESHDFSREEIKMGMEKVADVYGLTGITQTFLKNL